MLSSFVTVLLSSSSESDEEEELEDDFEDFEDFLKVSKKVIWTQFWKRYKPSA